MKLEKSALGATATALRFAVQSGWPAWSGLLMLLGGILMLVAAWHVDGLARRELETGPNLAQDILGNTSGKRPLVRTGEAALPIPSDERHLSDLRMLFRLARAKNVDITAVDYGLERISALRTVVRTLDIRIREDYPTLKVFLAALLRSMPHLAVKEIRIERKDATITRGQMLIKLAFVYRQIESDAATGAVGGR